MASFLPPAIYVPRLDQFVETSAGDPDDVLTADEFKDHSRVSSSAEDTTVIEPLIATAIAYLQDRLRAVLAESTWTLYLDEFPGSYRGLALPRFPLQALPSAADYLDADGVAGTFAASNFQLQTNAKPPYLVLADGSDWPATRWPLGGVAIHCTMGYSTVPEVFKRMVAYLTATLFENREDFEGPQAARGMLDALVRTHGMRL